MRIYCPNCGRPIRAGEMDLDASAAICSACGCTLSFAEHGLGHLDAAHAHQTPQRPFDARAIVEPLPTELIIRVPALGSGGRALASLVFLGFYLVVVLCWFGAAFDVNRNPLAWNAAVATVAIFLSAFALGPLGVAFWVVKGTLEIRIERETMKFETHCLVIHIAQRVSRSKVDRAQRQEFFGTDWSRYSYRYARKGPTPIPAVEIIHRQGSFYIPVESNAEGVWLMRLINEFLDRTLGTDKPSSVDQQSS